MQTNLIEDLPMIPPSVMNGSPKMVDHALEYAKRGWYVLPLYTTLETGMCSCGNDDCQSIGKHPRISNGCKGATKDEAIIEQWWKTWPDANIGIATGTVSGFVVLDVDPDRDGDKTLTELEQVSGDVPETLQSRTGSGGVHYLFLQPETVIKNSANKLGDGLDIRGEGGYIVAPPSLHRSGERYKWKNDNALLPMPAWMIDALVVDKSKSELNTDKPKEFLLTEHSAILKGERNDTLFRMASGLRGQGLTEPEILAALGQINEDRCEPPLHASELSTIAHSVCRYQPDEPVFNYPLVTSWGEFSTTKFPEVENILLGLERGEVGMLIAATNIGKTTLALNVALQLAAGGEFLPIAKAPENGLKVLYIDGETRKARLQRDIHVMQKYFNKSEKELVKKNLHIICDAEIDGFQLNLSDQKHMQIVKREVCRFEPDLIVVDTLACLFDLQSENDNAEVSKRVMKPLAGLAKDTNTAILLLHHVGKQSEDAQAGVKAYRGRGASASGGASRYTLLLTQHPNSPSRVILSNVKIKGIAFPDIVMKLDPHSRWFSPTSEDAPRKKSSYEDVIEAVKNFNREVSRKEIENAVKTISPSQIGKRLKAAVENGDLRLARYGVYCAPEVAHFTATVDDDQVTN